MSLKNSAITCSDISTMPKIMMILMGVTEGAHEE